MSVSGLHMYMHRQCTCTQMEKHTCTTQMNITGEVPTSDAPRKQSIKPKKADPPKSLRLLAHLQKQS